MNPSAPGTDEILKPLTSSPMASWLGYSARCDDAGFIHHLAFDDRHIGNPGIRAIHGGVVACFLEVAAQAELALRRGKPEFAKPVSNVVDYMNATKAMDLFARVRVDRIARRVAFLETTAWQETPEHPVAIGRICLRIAK